MSVLGNAADILRLFSADCTELTVGHVATRLGLPKANASRLMKAMRAAGMLETIGESRRHRPGRLFLNIAAAFRGSSLLMEMAAAAVARVGTLCGHTGYVSVRDGGDMMAVTDHPGTNALRVVSSLGRRLPAHGSATGRTLLARLADEEVALLYAGGLPPAATSAPPTLAALLARLGEIRRRGYDVSSDAAAAGIDAVAVAVGDPGQGELVSLCIVFPASVVGEDERRTIRRLLMDEAAAIARVTGDAGAARAAPVLEGAEG